jgi:hypothetical protein
MLNVKEVLQDKVEMGIECVDRVYLNGYVKDLQMPGGVINFIRDQKGWPIPSPQKMKEISQAFRKAVKQYATEQNIPLIRFEKQAKKEEVAKEYLARFEGQGGVVLIGKSQEKALGYKAQATRRGKRVWFEYSRQQVYVTHYYFYILDEQFGLFFIKICSYFPFEVKVCFNGHEWAKQQLQQAGIGFEALDNGFAACDDPGRLQEICHTLNALKIQALFDQWVEQLPWPLDAQDRAAGYRHQLSVWQLEVCQTLVFHDPAQGRALIEQIIRDNLDVGRPDRVSLIFERRVTKRTPSEFETQVIQYGVLPCIRIRYKHSTLRLYFKEGRALRLEMVINNTADFGLNRGLLDNWEALVGLARQCNERMLEQLRLSQDCFVPLDEVRLLGQPTRLENGQRASALRFTDERVMALLAALACHGFIPSELTNKTLRPHVAQFLNVSPEAYTSAQMSYDLRRLRLKGLVIRLPKSHTYCLTELGSKIAIFYTKLYQRVFRPGLAACVPEHLLPFPLAEALKTVASEINALFETIMLAPIAI